MNLEEDQFDEFMQGTLRMIAERKLNMNRNTYIGFINLNKLFDTVNWSLLITTLKRTGLERQKNHYEIIQRPKKPIKLEYCIFTARIYRVGQGCYHTYLMYS